MKEYKVFIISQDNFLTFKDRLIEIYLNSFTSGDFAQYISAEEAEKTWLKYAEIGKIYVALWDEQLVGALVAFPLTFDEDFPARKDISEENTLYIAELMTDKAFQNKGFGTFLVKYFLENRDKVNYPTVAIRVWDKNTPALSLYQKLGFQHTGISIIQKKHRTENETFTMRKNYLLKLRD